MRSIIVGALALCALAGSLEAQTYVRITGGITPTDRSATLSNVSSTLMAANTQRASLYISNQDATITVCYSFASPAVCSATGSYNLTAGQSAFWPAGTAPTSAVYIIAASGSPKVSAYEGQ